MKNEELISKVKQADDNTDAQYEIVELQQRIEDLSSDKEKLEEKIAEQEHIIKDKEYVINDCNVYIEDITDQLNVKNEECDILNEKMQNTSALEEEIAGLQSKVESLEAEVATLTGQVEDLSQQNVDKEDKIQQLETDLVAEHEQHAALGRDMAGYNVKVADLKAELVKRNEEIVGFVKIMKNIKDNLHSRGSPLSAFIDVTEVDSKELSWDHGYDNILEPAKNFIEKLVDESLERSKQGEADKSTHIRFLDERVVELENLLEEKEAMIEDFHNTDKDYQELQLKLEETEREQLDMQSYLNGKLSENKQLRHDLSHAQELNSVNEDKLAKAMSAIQGFVTENLKLSQDVAEKQSLLSVETKQVDILCLENERLKTELAQAVESNVECNGRAFYMQRGIEKARDEYSRSLGDYRVKFDSVLEAWKSSRDHCDLMRGRLEELADFLQTILDGEAEMVGDLNISSLSVDMRDLLQKSVDESRLLSASILASQTSVLQEMSMLGLEVGEHDVEQLGEETWLVPDVNVSVFEEEEGDEESVPKREYDCLLLELRDNLTKRRVAEEELEKLKIGFESLSVEAKDATEKSKIPVPDGSVKSRARSGSRRRKTLTKIPGPAAAAVTEDDDWSEPDKEESRRRIGLDNGEEERVGRRSVSDEETAGAGAVINAEDGAELRRERGRVERLRSELAACGKKEAELGAQLDRCRKELRKQQELVIKLELRGQQIEGESDQHREMLRLRMAENSDLEKRLKDANVMIGKLNKGIEWWKVECRRATEEFEIVSDSNSCGKELPQSHEVAKYKEIIEVKTTELKSFESKIKDLEKENEKLLNVIVETDEKELETLKGKYQKKKSELSKLKGTNLLLEERCLELEEVIKCHDAKITDVEMKVEKLQEVKRRQSLVISTKEENLSQAEVLLKELNASNKTLKTELEQCQAMYKQSCEELRVVKENFDKYQQEFSDEIIQNKVNEVETKMKTQAEGVKKMAEELVRMDETKKTLESKLLTRSDLLKTAEKEIRILKDSLESEKFKAEDLGKTIENMRNNIEKLETEKLRKDSLEKEFNSLQRQLLKERDAQKSLSDKIDQLEKSKKLTEERCLSAEKVLKTLSAESFTEDKENTNLSKLSSSKHELEAALHNSRPASRLRQGLASIDNNANTQGQAAAASRSSLPVNLTSSSASEKDVTSLRKQLETVTLERDAALAKLRTTRSSLASAAEKLSLSNKRKKEMEREICQQLSKTHQVLRKTKTNLETYSNQQT